MTTAALLLFGAATPVVAQTPALRPLSEQPTEGWLRDSVQRTLTSQGLVGAVWATVTSDGVVRTNAAGLANAATNERMTAEHRVQIGSGVKTLLALGVLRLVTEGRLSLETPIAELLPTLSIENAFAPRAPIRVRHLLDHTAGIDDSRVWHRLSLLPDADTPLEQAFTRNAATVHVTTEPGMRAAYSNQGYTLLGMIIERVTGQRYEGFLDGALLAPLGMTRSTFAFVTQTGLYSDSTLAMGHFADGRTEPTIPQYLRPATQFTTTASDMARLATFLLGDGTVGGRVLIAAPLLRAIGNPAGTEAARAGLTVGHALGLSRHDRHGVVALCHRGTGVGFRATFCVVPASRQAYFLSLNADVPTADYERIDRQLLRAMHIPVAAPVPATATDSNAGAWSGVYVPSPTRFVIRAYLDRLLGFVTLSSNEYGVRLSPFRGARSEMVPVGQRRYRAPGRTIASHVLVQAADGKRVLSDGDQNWVRIPRWRLIPLWISALVGMAGVIGLLGACVMRIMRRAVSRRDPAFWPIVSLLALAVPLPFFQIQPALGLGDQTIASVLTAFVTGMLPVAMAYGIVSNVRIGYRRTRASLRETYAMAALLQWLLVLALWGNIPLRLWG